MSESYLVKIDEMDIIALFTGDGAMDTVLGEVRDIVKAQVPDTSTAKGRKEIASLARKVASTKVALDTLGKEQVAVWKNKAKKVDAVRKDMRDTLDGIKEYARLPLTEWEAEEEGRLKAIALAQERKEAEDEAYAYEDLLERERVVRAREAEIAAKERAEKQKEAAEQFERERKEREAEIAEKAAERAREEAEQAIAQEQEKARLAEQARIAAEAKAEAAEREAQQRAREETERKEQAAKQEAERRAADNAHRGVIEAEAMADIYHAIVDSGESDPETLADSVIQSICDGHVRHVTITY